jgi:hypothetical protein
MVPIAINITLVGVVWDWSLSDFSLLLGGERRFEGLVVRY